MLDGNFWRGALLLIGALWSGEAAAATLITGAMVHDGTGAPGRRSAVRIDGARIVAVSNRKP